MYYEDQNEDEGYLIDLNLTGQEVYVVKFSPTGQPVYATFYGGQGTTRQYEYWQGGGDLLCELKVRNDRVYIAGTTNSWWLLPLHYTPPAYFNTTPPSSLDMDSPDQWNGFIANLSTLFNFDVGVDPIDLQQGANVAVFPSPAEHGVTLALPGTGTFQVSVELFDALGRTVRVINGIRATEGRVTLDVSTLAPGVYGGVIRGDRVYRFKLTKH